jgi:hypothetical protein
MMNPRCHRGRQGINLRRTRMVSFQSPQSRGRNRGSTTIHVLLPATASVNVNGSATVTARRNRKHSPLNLSGLASFPPLLESLSKAPPPRRNRAGILPRTSPLSLQGHIQVTQWKIQTRVFDIHVFRRRDAPQEADTNTSAQDLGECSPQHKKKRDSPPRPPYPPIPLGSALCIVSATYPILQPTERSSHRKQNSRKH